jgi:lipid II:glycine glycyltransferase (peptidoglycan interpeptide bridge formation enzyme)
MRLIFDQIEIEKTVWSEFVDRHPKGNIFQTPEMFSVFRKTLNNEPVFIAGFDAGMAKMKALMVSVIQKNYSGFFGTLTARAISWGAPLIVDNNPTIYDELLKSYNKQIQHRAIYSQFRNLFDMTDEMSSFSTNGFFCEDHLNILVNLEKSEEELWKDVYSKRRNEIRRAIREGTKMREITSETEIREAYTILSDVYQRAKVPLHDWSMFKAAYDILHPKGMVKYFGAINQGKIIGTIVVLCYKDRVYDWYAGSRKEYLNKYPNDLLPWEVFLWAKNEGFKIFDFGGAGKPNIPYGVRDYKKKFGGQMVNYGRFQKTHKPVLMKLGQLGLKIWQKLK